MTMMKVLVVEVFLCCCIITAHTFEAFNYDECGSEKTCLGFPEDCLADKDCVTMSSTYKKDGKYIFEMRSYKGAAYIAMALSSDNKMGQDSVMECVKNKRTGKVELYSSWTEIINGDYKATREGAPQEIIRLVESRIEDNRIFCHVERDAITNVRGVEFNLNTSDYFMLLASGTALEKNSVGYHDYAYTPSEKKVKFNK